MGFSDNEGRRHSSRASGVYSSDPCLQLPGRAIPASRWPAGPPREVSDRTRRPKFLAEDLENPEDLEDSRGGSDAKKSTFFFAGDQKVCTFFDGAFVKDLP